MNQERMKLMRAPASGGKKKPERLTYWRSGPTCFSIDYKGIITEICEGDLGYGDMNRLDGAIHAAIGCKRKTEKCGLKRVE
jgi:hypothetical protein